MITEEQIDILHHALGSSTSRSPLGWRNQYCALTGDSDCESLVEQGLMNRGVTINEGRNTYYFVTPLGKKLCGVKPEDDKRPGPRAALEGK